MRQLLSKHEIRRLRLLELRKDEGSYRAIARKVRPKSKHYEAHITNIASGERTMGDSLARDFEEAFGKSQGWMDTLGESDRIVQIIELAKRLPTDEQDHLIGELKVRTLISSPHSPKHDNFMRDLADAAERLRKKYEPKKPVR